MFSRTAFRQTAPSRSSSTTATGDRRRSGRRQISWSAAEAAEAIAAPGVAVTSPAGGDTVTTMDREEEDRAVAARLDRAWRRLAEAHETTEGRPGGIGDDTARRDPVTRPFPIAFGTPTRDPRSSTSAPVAPATGLPARPLPDRPAAPAPARPVSAASAASAAVPSPGSPAGPRPVRRGQAAVAMHRPAGVGQVPRLRAPRRLTADRWSTAVG